MPLNNPPVAHRLPPQPPPPAPDDDAGPARRPGPKPFASLRERLVDDDTKDLLPEELAPSVAHEAPSATPPAGRFAATEGDRRSGLGVEERVRAYLRGFTAMAWFVPACVLAGWLAIGLVGTLLIGSGASGERTLSGVLARFGEQGIAVRDDSSGGLRDAQERLGVVTARIIAGTPTASVGLAIAVQDRAEVAFAPEPEASLTPQGRTALAGADVPAATAAWLDARWPHLDAAEWVTKMGTSTRDRTRWDSIALLTWGPAAVALVVWCGWAVVRGRRTAG